MSENEKDKEIKKMSEAESYEEYEGEAIEDVEEGPESEEAPSSEVRVPLDIYESAQILSVSDSDRQSAEESSQEGDEERRRHLLREKWLSVTGKKPRNIPTLRKPFEETVQKHIFFGDRKPGEVEKNIRRRLLLAAQSIETKGLKHGKVLHEIMLPALFSGLLCLRFDPTAEFLACSDRKGGLQIRQAETGEVLRSLHTFESSERLAVRSLRYFPHNSERIYAVGQTGSVQVFNTESAELIGATEAAGSIYNMDISQDGIYLATGGKEGKIQVIDPSTLQLISMREWPNKGEPIQPNVYDEYHKMRIFGLKFHQTETNLFATGGWDSTVKVWDVRTQAAIRSINGPAVYGDGLDIRDNEILTATWRVEDSLNLWDFSSGKLIKNIPIKSKSTKFEGEFLYTCRFFSNFGPGTIDKDLAAIGGSGFSDVLLINIKSDKIEEHFPSFKPIMCMDISGNLLAYGGTESVFRIGVVESKRRTTVTRR